MRLLMYSLQRWPKCDVSVSLIALYLLSFSRWIDGESGRRSDVAHYFIYNQDHTKNLHVATGCRVKRVLIECVYILVNISLS